MYSRASGSFQSLIRAIETPLTYLARPVEPLLTCFIQDVATKMFILCYSITMDVRIISLLYSYRTIWSGLPVYSHCYYIAIINCTKIVYIGKLIKIITKLNYTKYEGNYELKQ